MVVRGGVDGYLRPDQFLDHLTVIINFDSTVLNVMKYACFLAPDFFSVYGSSYIISLSHLPESDDHCPSLILEY